LLKIDVVMCVPSFIYIVWPLLLKGKFVYLPNMRFPQQMLSGSEIFTMGFFLYPVFSPDLIIVSTV